MYNQIRIDDDRTTWGLSQPIGPAEIIGAKKPLAIPFTSPLSGTLLLNVRATSVSLLPSTVKTSVIPWGWIPGGAGGVPPLIYLPWAFSGVATKIPGPVELPGTINLGALQGQLIEAMTAGTRVEVPLGPKEQGSVLVLDGAMLPFVALIPAQPSGIYPPW